MKPTELRIGNYILAHLTQGIVIVDWMVLRHMEQGNYQNVYFPDVLVYEPIPLTEEWLVKFGGEKSTWGSRQRDAYYFKDTHFITIDNSCFVFRLANTAVANIYYVHQLQNLYYALTGEELVTSTKEP
jgi:hypothetical protein